MKTGIFLAVLFHVAFLLFGGIIFGTHKQAKPKLVEVALDETVETEKPKEEPQQQQTPDQEMIKPTDDLPPDVDTVIAGLDRPTQAPALAAMSLEAISSLLGGGGGGGSEFAVGGGNFSSGGVIGGTGKAGLLKESEEAVFSSADIDQKPRQIFQIAPSFPAEMRGKDKSGSVTVIFIVEADGRVTNLKAENASHPAFEKPAIDAVKQWRYDPAVRGGQKVASRMKVTIQFQKS